MDRPYTRAFNNQEKATYENATSYAQQERFQKEHFIFQYTNTTKNFKLMRNALLSAASLLTALLASRPFFQPMNVELFRVSCALPMMKIV